MILAANTFGPGFDSPQLHQAQKRNRAGYRLISDRCIHLKGLTGFDSVIMAKGGNSGHIKGNTINMFSRPVALAPAA